MSETCLVKKYWPKERKWAPCGNVAAGYLGGEPICLFCIAKTLERRGWRYRAPRGELAQSSRPPQEGR